MDIDDEIEPLVEVYLEQKPHGLSVLISTSLEEFMKYGIPPEAHAALDAMFQTWLKTFLRQTSATTH